MNIDVDGKESSVVKIDGFIRMNKKILEDIFIG